MADETSKGISIEELETPVQQLKRTNYLLAIGIDDYVHVPKLYNCKKDIDDLVAVLTQKYHFEKKNIKTLFNENATKGKIYKAFRQMAQKITHQDNLIIYFSGHGEFDNVFNQGYWIPVNAQEGEHDQYIPNSEIKTILSAIKSHHTFLISDSCFSGALFAKGLGKNVSRRYEKDPSRWGLTAGRNEIVSDGQPGDNSPFAESLLYRLKNSNTAIGVAQLCAHVTEYVQANSNQTPIGEPLKVDGHKNGQFVFHLKKDALTDWKNAQATNTIAAYQAFIQMHPKHTEVLSAKAAISILEAQALWNKIQKAPEATGKEVVKKIRLVDQYAEKYEQQSHYTEALDLGILLEYKRDFLDAKGSEFMLRRFLQKRMPQVEGADEIKTKAQKILTDRRVLEEQEEKKAQEKAAEEKRQQEEQHLKEQKRKAETKRAKEQRYRERAKAEKAAEQNIQKAITPKPQPSPQPNNLKYILGGIGILLIVGLLWMARSCGPGAIIDESEPEITKEQLAQAAWNRIPQDNTDSLRWFIKEYRNSKFEPTAQTKLEELEKPEPVVETTPAPPNWHNLKPNMTTKFEGDNLKIMIAKKGLPPYILQVEKDGKFKDNENYKEPGTYTYAIGRYREDSGQYKLRIKDANGRSFEKNIKIDPPKKVFKPEPPKRRITPNPTTTTKPAVTTTKPTTTGSRTFTPEMVRVQGGTFKMGCTSEQDNCDDDEKPVHSVTVSSFSIGKFEVTVKEYLAFCNETGGNYPEWLEKGNKYHIDTGTADYYKRKGYNRNSSNLPIVGVSWNNAKAYCNWLSRKTGQNFRLPTEAEWEFAARGGNKSRSYQFSGSNSVGDVAWYSGNSGGKSHQVGTKRANELGIYDMSGNVWEWCLDDMRDYTSSSQTNPKGSTSSSSRALRGGSWDNNGRVTRVANRNRYVTDNRIINFGFRVARD